MTRAVNLAQAGSSAIVQVVQKFIPEVTTTSSTYTYVTVTNGNLAVTSTFANSKFLVTYSVQGYQSGSACVNVGLQRTISGTTTRLLGVDGTSGNEWMGAGNGPVNNSWTIAREYLDNPAQPAGTTITYQLLLGNWSPGTAYFGYSGYSPENFITIMEIAG